MNPNNPNIPTITVIGAANSAVINLASGNDVVSMGAGETLNGGSGNDTIMVTAATIGDVINGGSGRSTLQFGGGGSATLGSTITNIAELQLKAAATAYDAVANSIAGLTVLDSDTANADTIQAGGANQTLIGGGAGKLTFIGAANTDFVDTITLFNHDTIQNFLVGDSIDLTNLGIHRGRDRRGTDKPVFLRWSLFGDAGDDRGNLDQHRRQRQCGEVHHRVGWWRGHVADVPRLMAGNRRERVSAVSPS